MPRAVHEKFDERAFAALKRRKDRLGLTWSQVVVQGLDAIERERVKMEA